MIARLYRHAHPRRLPPVDSLAYRQDNAVLRWGFGGPGRDDEARLAHALGFEFLDHYPVEEGFEQVLCHR